MVIIDFSSGLSYVPVIQHRIHHVGFRLKRVQIETFQQLKCSFLKIFLGQMSRMAYIKDYELRQIFLENMREDEEFAVPCTTCEKTKKQFDKSSKEFKWNEIYAAVKDIVSMPALR